MAISNPGRIPSLRMLQQGTACVASFGPLSIAIRLHQPHPRILAPPLPLPVLAFQCSAPDPPTPTCHLCRLSNWRDLPVAVRPQGCGGGLHPPARHLQPASQLPGIPLLLLGALMEPLPGCQLLQLGPTAVGISLLTPAPPTTSHPTQPHPTPPMPPMHPSQR